MHLHMCIFLVSSLKQATHTHIHQVFDFLHQMVQCTETAASVTSVAERMWCRKMGRPSEAPALPKTPKRHTRASSATEAGGAGARGSRCGEVLLQPDARRAQEVVETHAVIVPRLDAEGRVREHRTGVIDEEGQVRLEPRVQRATHHSGALLLLAEPHLDERVGEPAPVGRPQPGGVAHVHAQDATLHASVSY